MIDTKHLRKDIELMLQHKDLAASMNAEVRLAWSMPEVLDRLEKLEAVALDPASRRLTRNDLEEAIRDHTHSAGSFGPEEFDSKGMLDELFEKETP